MPGEKPLPIDVTPDFMQTVVLNFNSVVGTDQALFFCERDTVIDRATLLFTTGDTNDTYSLRHCTTSGTPQAPSAGTLFTDVVTGVTANTPKHFTLVDTANVVPAGSYIALDIAATTAAAKEGIIQLRIRTKRR